MPFKNSISGADPAKQIVPVPDLTKNSEPHKKVIYKGYFLLYASKIIINLLAENMLISLTPDEAKRD